MHAIPIPAGGGSTPNRQGKVGATPSQLLSDLPLFRSVPSPAPAPRIDSLREKLAAIAPDSLSPREAHDLLYALKGLADKEGA